MRHRCFKAGYYGKFAGLNYQHPRPFRAWKPEHMETLIRSWLAQNPPCLELATLALEELNLRGSALGAEMCFADADLAPISWLSAARENVRTTFTPQVLERDKSGRLGSNVYVILRGGYSAENGWYGAYVGSTSKTVKQRYLEHRNGPRAARGLPKHGIEPLFSLFDLINPVQRKGEKLREWETRLHKALAPVIPKVTGDVAF